MFRFSAPVPAAIGARSGAVEMIGGGGDGASTGMIELVSCPMLSTDTLVKAFDT